MQEFSLKLHLQYTLLLLIQIMSWLFWKLLKNLQYTLLLLIPLFFIFNSLKNLSFTIHFATINTRPVVKVTNVFISFTIHFATINTKITPGRHYHEIDLQYTLLLLILSSCWYHLLSFQIYNTLCYY